MSYNFRENMALAIQHEPRVRELIGRNVIRPASMTLDTRHATDLITFTHASVGSIAARVRRNNSYPTFQFTIRDKSRFGGVTEYQKFLNGHANWMFYGVLDESERDFQSWILFNLNIWRSIEQKHIAGGSKHGTHIDYQRNRDGSAFRIYDATRDRYRLADGFMIDCHEPLAFGGRVVSSNYTRSKCCAA